MLNHSLFIKNSGVARTHKSKDIGIGTQNLLGSFPADPVPVIHNGVAYEIDLFGEHFALFGRS